MGVRSINELWYAFLEANLPAGFVAGTTSTVTAGSQATNAATTSSVHASGTVSAPGAGASIATTGNLTGLYEVEITTMLLGSGSPVDADADNLAVNAPGVRLYPGLIKGVPSPPRVFKARLTNTAVTVAAVGAATANVTYKASIIATKIAD